MQTRRLFVVPFTGLAFALAVSSAEVVAFAQEEPNASDVAAARALGQEGVKLADAGNCNEAIERLARAEKMYHAPTTLGRLGECQVQTGRLVEGTENLNRVAREAISPSAPPAFLQAQERAKKVLAEAKPKIAKLKIAVAAPADAVVTVKVDNEVVPNANLNTNRPIDPGEHTVEATAPGFLKAQAKVKLAEAGVDSVALTLEPDPNAPKGAAVAPVPAAMTATTTTTTTQDTTSGPPNRTPAYITLGVGIVGLGVGAVTGFMALGKKSDLDDACPDKARCPASVQDTIDSGQTLATVSTIGFVVGVLGVGIGTYMLVSSGSGSASGAKAKALVTPPKPRVEPVIGVGRFGLTGTF